MSAVDREKIEKPEHDSISRLSWAWTAVFYLSVLVPLIVFTLESGHTSRERFTAAGLSLAGAVWYWFFSRRHQGLQAPFSGVSTPALIYLAGAYAILFSLIWLDPIFYLHLFGVAVQVFVNLPPRWALPCLAVLAGLSIFEQAISAPNGFAFNDPVILYTLAAFLVGGFLYIWVSGVILQSEQRRELIRQLRETQEELARSERNAGILSERQRLAGEIHDTLAQGFTSIVMLLEAAEAVLPEEHPTLQYLEQARRTGRQSLEQARRLVWELRPQALEHASIADALKRTLFSWAHDTGLEAEFNQTGESLNLHPQVEITLLRALQEALANVHKHARASQVSVTLSFIGGLVVLDVQDNGGGFVPSEVLQAEATPSHGYGLVAMRKRLERVNGRQIVESAPGGGTTLVVEIPVAE